MDIMTEDYIGLFREKEKNTRTLGQLKKWTLTLDFNDLNTYTALVIKQKQMTEHIPNVLPHIQELKETWRRQDFKFTKDQQEQYDLLLATRRERVKEFYADGRVSKGRTKAED